MAYSGNNGGAGSRILKIGQGVDQPKSLRERGRPHAAWQRKSCSLSAGRGGAICVLTEGLAWGNRRTEAGDILEEERRERKQTGGIRRWDSSLWGCWGKRPPAFPALSASVSCRVTEFGWWPIAPPADLHRRLRGRDRLCVLLFSPMTGPHVWGVTMLEVARRKARCCSFWGVSALGPELKLGLQVGLGAEKHQVSFDSFYVACSSDKRHRGPASLFSL